MNTSPRLNFTFYLACAIEHAKTNDNAQDWKQPVKEAFNSPLIGIYDPIEREAQKTGSNTNDTCNSIVGLKRSGKWEQFDEKMDQIWWGNIDAQSDKLRVILALRQRFLIDGNVMEDLNFWADYEAVIRSNFILAYLQKNVKTVGTIMEIHIAYLLNIPVYLILPEQNKTETNSSLLHRVRKSNGEIFYTVNDCIKYLKEKYRI